MDSFGWQRIRSQLWCCIYKTYSFFGKHSALSTMKLEHERGARDKAEPAVFIQCRRMKIGVVPKTSHWHDVRTVSGRRGGWVPQPRYWPIQVVFHVCAWSAYERKLLHFSLISTHGIWLRGQSFTDELLLFQGLCLCFSSVWAPKLAAWVVPLTVGQQQTWESWNHTQVLLSNNMGCRLT